MRSGLAIPDGEAAQRIPVLMPDAEPPEGPRRKSPWIRFASDPERYYPRATLLEIRTHLLENTSERAYSALELVVVFLDINRRDWRRREVKEYRKSLGFSDAAESGIDPDAVYGPSLQPNSSPAKLASALIGALEEKYGRNSTPDQWEKTIIALKSEYEEVYKKKAPEFQRESKGGQVSELPKDLPPQPQRKTYPTPKLKGLVSVQTYVTVDNRSNITAIAAAKDKGLVEYLADLIEKDVEANPELIPIGKEKLKQPKRYKTKRMQLEAENRQLRNLVKRSSPKPS